MKQYISKAHCKPQNYGPNNEHRNGTQSDVRFASALEHQTEASSVGELPM